MNPSATCYIYDNDSTDFVLSWLDMNHLTDGGAYEIDFSGYTLRVTAAVQDDPESVLGKCLHFMNAITKEPGER